MKKRNCRIIQFASKAAPVEGMRLGRIVRVDGDGAVLVDFPGNCLGPIAARVTTTLANYLLKAPLAGREVLLAFHNQDATLPIIVDAMQPLVEEIADPAATLVAESGEIREVTVDGRRIVFQAEDEIVLNCGKASITLTKAGKVLIRGEYLLSHSSGENRIKGGSIAIN